MAMQCNQYFVRAAGVERGRQAQHEALLSAVALGRERDILLYDGCRPECRSRQKDQQRTPSALTMSAPP